MELHLTPAIDQSEASLNIKWLTGTLPNAGWLIVLTFNRTPAS